MQMQPFLSFFRACPLHRLSSVNPSKVLTREREREVGSQKRMRSINSVPISPSRAHADNSNLPTHFSFFASLSLSPNWWEKYSGNNFIEFHVILAITHARRACEESRASARPLGPASYRGTRSGLGEPRRSVAQRAVLAYTLPCAPTSTLFLSFSPPAEISINHGPMHPRFCSVSFASRPFPRSYNR